MAKGKPAWAKMNNREWNRLMAEVRRESKRYERIARTQLARKRADVSYREQVEGLNFYGLGYEDYEEVLTVEEQREREEQEMYLLSLPFEEEYPCCWVGICHRCPMDKLWADYERMRREEKEQDEGLRWLERNGWVQA